MAHPSKTNIRTLAIDPTTNGFGFAVMEGPESLIDWGVKDAGAGDKNARCLEIVSALIDHYMPDVLVVEDYRNKGFRRCERVRRLIQDIMKLALKKRVKARKFNRSEVREAFSGSGTFTKHGIATTIAERLLELAPRLPPYRHAWMSEDYRMAIFDAVALALTFFHFESHKGKDELLALGINSSNHVQ